jgi:hypothetical protein
MTASGGSLQASEVAMREGTIVLCTAMVCATVGLLGVLTLREWHYALDNDRFHIVNSDLYRDGNLVLDRRTGEVSRVAHFTVDDKGTQRILNNPLERFYTPPRVNPLAGIKFVPSDTVDLSNVRGPKKEFDLSNVRAAPLTQEQKDQAIRDAEALRKINEAGK